MTAADILLWPKTVMPHTELSVKDGHSSKNQSESHKIGVQGATDIKTLVKEY